MGKKYSSWCFYPRSPAGANACGAVSHYTANQVEHHRVKPFREELIEMLHRAEIEFEERLLD